MTLSARSQNLYCTPPVIARSYWPPLAQEEIKICNTRDIYIYFICIFQLLEGPWSQLSSLLHRGAGLHIYRAEGAEPPLLADFHRLLRTHALALPLITCLLKNKIFTRVYEYALKASRNCRIDSSYEGYLLKYRGHLAYTRQQKETSTKATKRKENTLCRLEPYRFCLAAQTLLLSFGSRSWWMHPDYAGKNRLTSTKLPRRSACMR